jgi:hypothetical protein
VGLSYASGWLPIPSNFAISGSATVPAYNLVPSDRLLATGTDARWFQLEPSDGFITSWLQAVSTDVYGQVGTASISWQLTPAMRPGARRQ